MSVKRIFMIIGALLSGVGLFLPIYSLQVNGKTMADGAVSMMPGVYGIVILLADLVVIGSAVVALKKGYVIATLISVGVSIYSMANAMMAKAGSSMLMGVTSNYLGSLTGAKYTVVDGPAPVLIILGAVVMLLSMLWAAFTEDS